MGVFFFLVRLPFFLLGVAFWVLMGAVVVALVLALAPLVAIFGGGFWLFVIVPGQFLGAAFKNDIGLFKKFIGETLQWANEKLGEVELRIAEYFKEFSRLADWLARGGE